MISPYEIEQMILKILPGSQVKVLDMTGTADHFDIVVVSEAFKDKSLIEQHKMVFSILEKEMDNRIHAIRLKTQVGGQTDVKSDD